MRAVVVVGMQEERAALGKTSTVAGEGRSSMEQGRRGSGFAWGVCSSNPGMATGGPLRSLSRGTGTGRCSRGAGLAGEGKAAGGCERNLPQLQECVHRGCDVCLSQSIIFVFMYVYTQIQARDRNGE